MHGPNQYPQQNIHPGQHQGQHPGHHQGHHPPQGQVHHGHHQLGPHH